MGDVEHLQLSTNAAISGQLTGATLPVDGPLCFTNAALVVLAIVWTYPLSNLSYTNAIELTQSQLLTNCH